MNVVRQVFQDVDEAIVFAVGLFLAVLSAVTFVAGLILMPIIVVRIPPDYFVGQRPSRWQFERHQPMLRAALLIAKNVLGAALAIAGVIMALPFVPGPGIIAVIVGIALMDIPGKRALEQKIVSYRFVLGSINRLRARYGHPPLLSPQSQQLA